MKPNTDIKILVCCLFMAFLLSCAKNGDPITPGPPATHCKVVNAIITDGKDTTDAFTYTYTSDGKLATTTHTGTDAYTVQYTYNGNTIYRAVSAGVNSSVDTLVLNAAGLITSRKEVTSAATTVNLYAYNTQNQLLTERAQQVGYPASLTTYTFMNGDLVKIVDSATGATTNMLYDLDHLAVGGNLEQFNEFLSIGAMYTNSQHLLVSLQPPTGVKHDFTYVFTPGGDIASVKDTYGSNIQIISYTYNCK